ncbi:MAG: HD domain-containing protein [Gammaproteobacteria bacterium]|nr:MAG: HD domain-containing protein [Gammaproteobacteria bacterium]
MVRQRYDFIDRIAIALYDGKTDILRTFAWSSDQDSPLRHYQSKLGDARSLMEIVEKGMPRVVNDMEVFVGGIQKHTQVLAKAGFGSSYTMPMYKDGYLAGFIFFNSYAKDVLKEAVLIDLDMIGHMISLLVANEKSVLETLQATVRTAMSFTHHRDPETATHIDRMSRYSQLIARELASEYGFDDQFVEHVFLFSPLHDLGKIGIPDRILLKNTSLTEAEFDIMKTHAIKGREMIDAVLQNFGLDGVAYVEILRNIAQHHHEAYDGSGYPAGLSAEAIPIEARIVAVADVFDALTSRRPYKPAWSNDRAFEALRNMAGHKLDARCVEVLIAHRAEVEDIQQRFQENPFG